MPAKLYRIKLTEDERQELEVIRDNRRGQASKALRASALLMADEGPLGPCFTDARISIATGLAPRTIERLRERCCEVGPLGALERKAREKPPVERKITGEVEARIIQLACSKPPEGHARWTLRFLAKHLVEIGVIESISHQAVGTVLKKANLNLGDSNAGASRPRRTLLS